MGWDPRHLLELLQVEVPGAPARLTHPRAPRGHEGLGQVQEVLRQARGLQQLGPQDGEGLGVEDGEEEGQAHGGGAGYTSD